MKLLLTSGGIKNPTIKDALVGILGKPVGECNALFIPTVLELTALPSIGADRWVPWVREADVLLVDGGEAMYLWVGMSAGSMVMTPRIGDSFVNWPAAEGDQTLGVVDFSIFPHLDYPDWPDNTLASARQWATKIPGPAYAIDDETAISVVDGAVEVVSEGHWELLNSG